MFGLGMQELIVIGFVFFDMLVVGAIVMFVVAKRSGASRSAGSPGEAQRIAELERQVAQLKRQQEQSGLSGNTSNAFNNASPFDSPFGTVSAGNASASGMGDSDILDLLRHGQKLEAIKRYRERTGLGLKESKDAIEAMQRQMGI